jgi:hypothetical protein
VAEGRHRLRAIQIETQNTDVKIEKLEALLDTGRLKAPKEGEVTENHEQKMALACKTITTLHAYRERINEWGVIIYDAGELIFKLLMSFLMIIFQISS